jgi:hypothetical protein
MRKVIVMFLGLSMFAMASLPVQANPTRKKITVECEGPDSYGGYADVSLCSSMDGNSCVGETIPCTEVTCTDDGTTSTSMTVTCDATFKIVGITANYGIQNASSTQSTVAIGGKGVTLSYMPTSGPDTSDTVTLIVK